MIIISPFSFPLLYRAENRWFSTLRCTKIGGTQPKLSAACFVVQSCLADADFVVFSNYCLIGTRLKCGVFSLFLLSLRLCRLPWRWWPLPLQRSGILAPRSNKDAPSAVHTCVHRRGGWDCGGVCSGGFASDGQTVFISLGPAERFPYSARQR